MIPKRIVFAGSSSIHGRGDSEFGGFVHRFRLWHESSAPGHFVYELGIFGESTTSLISRLVAEASIRKPHLIALYPGFNDIRRDGGVKSENAMSQNAFRASMATLITEAKTVAPVFMMTGFPFDEKQTTPYPGTRSYYLRKDAETYTRSARSVCRENGVPMLDYFALWSTKELPKLLTEDGLHANALGHQLLFEQLRDFIVNEYS